MIMRQFPLRFIAASLLAVILATLGTRGKSAEVIQTNLTLAPDAQTRLVLDYWPADGWMVRQDGRQIEMIFPGVQLAISTDAIPLPAGGGEVLTLNSSTDEEATYLRIGLGCDCIVALQGDRSHLEIEIVNSKHIAELTSGVATQAPLNAPLPIPRRPDADITHGDITHGLSEIQQVEMTRVRLLDELRRAAESGLITLRADTSGVLATSIAAPTHDPMAEIKINPISEKVVERTNGQDPAASISTVQSALPAPAEVPDQALAAEKFAPALIANAESPKDGAPLAAQIQAVSPLAQESPEILISVPAQPTCFSNESFSLSDPLPASVLLSEISRLRSALVGEFDHVDTVVAVELARLYLAHGLGVEAAGVLSEFAPKAPESGQLAALAALVEGRSLPTPNILSVPECTGQHALWQAFDSALGERHSEAGRYEVAASGALEQTARGLRGLVAVRLGLSAAAIRNWEAAYRLNTMAKRSISIDDRDGRELRSLLEAKLSIARGDTSVALGKINSMLTARSPAGLQAVIMRAELSRDPVIGTMVQLDQLREDLGTFAFTQRDTPEGEQAFIAEVELTDRHNGRDAAFELLAYGSAGRIIGESAYRKALAELGASVTGFPDDTPLALLYEANPQSFANAIADTDFRIALARSYLSLGAPILAEKILLRSDLENVALLGEVANSHLEIGDIDAARRFAQQLPDGPAKAAIDAGAALAAGDAVAALANLTVAGAPAAQRARTAWAAGAWAASTLALEDAIIAQRSEAALDLSVPAIVTTPQADEQSAKHANASIATRLALAALNSGRASLPQEALSLSADDPELAAGLQAILVRSEKSLADGSPIAVNAFLESVSSEARLFEEILNDG